MAEMVHEFTHDVAGEDGRRYRARAFGEEQGHLWKAWLEFTPADGGETLRTDSETSQPNRDAVVYWASGIEQVYLQGALSRAR
jgi:hypothetical protein